MGQEKVRSPLYGRLLLRQGVNTYKQLQLQTESMSSNHSERCNLAADRLDKLTQQQQLFVDSQLIDEIKAEARALLNQDIAELPMEVFNLFKETGSRKEFENLYFSRRKRLTALALMAIIEPEQQQYVDELVILLEKICTEFTWCLPAHYNDEHSLDLFAAETAFTLAEISDLIGDRLPEQLLATMKAEVFQRVINPFIAQRHGWESAHHNWASVCAGSIGAAALYYMEDDEQLPLLLERVVRAMECYLKGFQEDGVCAEGYGYWQYGFGYFVYFADLLYEYSNGKTNLFAADKVKQIALFQQKCFLGGKHVVNFSDSPPTAGVFMGLTHYLHQLFDEVTIPLDSCRAGFTEDHCGRWAPAVRNLLWLKQHQGTEWQAASYPLEQAQWLISKIEKEGSHLTFAAKGGHNNEPHNHNDLGHFIVAINGKSLLLDLGSGLYTKEYFGEGRYNYICTSSAGHSVPIIAGMQQLEGEEAQAELIELSAGDQFDRLVLELSRAYNSESLTRFQRAFQWNKSNGQLTLTDQFQFSGEGETITERLIAASKPYLLEPNCLVIDDEEGKLLILFDPEQLDWQCEAFQYIDHFNNPMERYRIDFQLKQLAPNVSIQLHISTQCVH